MRNVDKLKIELKEAIIDSDEYKEYLQYRAIVEKNPDLMRAVNLLRKQNFELQNAEYVGDMYQSVDDMRRQFDYIYSQDMVSHFLTSELCLCRMIQDVCKEIIRDIDINLDFLG